MSEKGGWGGRREGAGSGGPRPGAGRPESTITIRLGDKLLLSRRQGDGVTPSEIATVTKIGQGVITLETDEGDVITLIR